MLRMIGAAACILGLFYAAGTVAQDVTGRYAIKEVEDGLIRLDTQTGTVSHCSKKVTDWVCEAVADERKAYQDEISRLAKENEDLRSKIASAAEARKKSFPGDQEFEQAMNFVEKFMRRFFEFAKSMKDQIGKET